MGRTMAERASVTKTIATRYKQANKSAKAKILDELCANTGWHRDHARKALRSALIPKTVRERTPSTTEIRTQCHCGPYLLLDSAGHACWQTPRAGAPRTRTDFAHVR